LRKGEATPLFTEEGKSLMDKTLLEEARGATVARWRGVFNTHCLSKHIIDHGSYVFIVCLFRVEHFLRGGAIEDVCDTVDIAHSLPYLAEYLLGASTMITLVKMENDALSRLLLLGDPDKSLFYLLVSGNGEDLHVLSGKLFALVIICLAVPSREKRMDARGPFDRVTLGNVLYHLALATLDRGPHNDTTAFWIIQEGNDVITHEPCKVRAQLLELIGAPRLQWHRHLVGLRA